jgi:predicted transcriptional regulator
MMNMANRSINRDAGGSVRRSSISFSDDIYDSLEKLAYQKKVSIAWVVREAVESYIYTQEGQNTLSSAVQDKQDA